MDKKEFAGVIGFFDGPESLIQATQAVKESKLFKGFDCYTPFPVHGLLEAQGIERSPLPFITFGAGITGCSLGLALQYWTSVVDWPLNISGKPFFSLPAFVPVMFECTILFAGLATVGGMFILNRLPNSQKKAFDPSITRDRFALVIEPPCDEQVASDWLKKLGAQDIRNVYAEGWF